MLSSAAVAEPDVLESESRSRLVTKAAIAPANKAVVPVPSSKAASSFRCRANSVSAKPLLTERLARIACLLIV